jgi:hypothetical protein
MKILISSKELASNLNKIHFGKDRVKAVGAIANHFIIKTQEKTFDILLNNVIETGKMTDQSRCRWDWIRDLVNKVSEQPIVLEITKNRVDVIFQF